MKLNKGFTLVELIVVIVILSILAVTALPKFISFEGDAYKTNLEALQATIKTANASIIEKSIFQGQLGCPATITNTDITGLVYTTPVCFGYISPSTTAAKFAEIVKISQTDWIIESRSGSIFMTQVGSPSEKVGGSVDDSAACFLSYTVGDDTSTPNVANVDLYDLQVSGC